MGNRNTALDTQGHGQGTEHHHQTSIQSTHAAATTQDHDTSNSNTSQTSFHLLRSLSGVDRDRDRDRQRARSLSAVPDLRDRSRQSDHHHHHLQEHDQGEEALALPMAVSVSEAMAVGVGMGVASPGHGNHGHGHSGHTPLASLAPSSVMSPSALSSALALGRVYAAHSLPSHIWSLNGIKCPLCSKFVLPDDIEFHLAMCLNKPRLSYNEDILSDCKGECVICLEDLDAGDTIARLPCLCIYHKGCIDQWFEVNRSCPEHPGD